MTERATYPPITAWSPAPTPGQAVVAAAVHYIAQMPDRENWLCWIVTADGKEWFGSIDKVLPEHSLLTLRLHGAPSNAVTFISIEAVIAARPTRTLQDPARNVK